MLNLRSKLDATGHNEIDCVVAVELTPNATQAELVAALEPVVDRLMKRLYDPAAAIAAAVLDFNCKLCTNHPVGMTRVTSSVELP